MEAGCPCVPWTPHFRDVPQLGQPGSRAFNGTLLRCPSPSRGFHSGPAPIPKPSSGAHASSGCPQQALASRDNPMTLNKPLSTHPELTKFINSRWKAQAVRFRSTLLLFSPTMVTTIDKQAATKMGIHIPCGSRTAPHKAPNKMSRTAIRRFTQSCFSLAPNHESAARPVIVEVTTTVVTSAILTCRAAAAWAPMTNPRTAAKATAECGIAPRGPPS